VYVGVTASLLGVDVIDCRWCCHSSLLCLCSCNCCGAATQVNLLTNSSPTARNWFPHLQELRLLGHVAASDADLPALTALTALQKLSLHLQKPSRGLAGRVTLRGLWGLAQSARNLQEIRLTGAMETTLMVPGRAPGVGF
jgi:hypothetical protein